MQKKQKEKKEKKQKRILTFKKYVGYFIICLLIFQAITFAIVLALGGSLQNIISNSFRPLTETSALRVKDFEIHMNSAANLLRNNSSAIKSNMQIVADKYGRPISQLADNQDAKVEMYQNNVDLLASMAIRENITGAFLIIDNRTEVDYGKMLSVNAMFLRKADEATENANAPTTLLIGDERLTQNGHTHKDIYWTQDLQKNYTDYFDFYEKPLEIAENNNGIACENLGYWSYTYDLNGSNQKVLAYSVPIRDSVNKVVGVMGIEMDLSYLQLLLPYYELNSQGKGNYLVTCTENLDESNGIRVFTSGNGFNDINRYSDEIEFSSKSNSEGVYKLIAKGKNVSKVYCTKHVLNINGDAKYSYSPWILSGVVESKYLLSYVNKLELNIALAFVITMILSILFALKFVDRMVAPINAFVDTIRKIRPDNLLKPELTKIQEINELGTSVADLTAEISSFSTKTTAILSLTGISIGAFEYDPDSNLVFCTEEMFKMLSMQQKDNELYMEKAVFNNRITPFIKAIKPDIDIISPVQYANDTRWLHMKTVTSGGKILGIIRDVTEETLEKQKHTYERDHDPLTSFLNRQPFLDRLIGRFTTRAPALAMFAVCRIPDLKTLNKRYGSLIGDKYVKSLAEVFDRMDKRYTTVARTMGDEFAFVIEGRTEIEITRRFESLLEELNNSSFTEGELEVQHNVFVGVSWYPDDTQSVEELIVFAEFAAQGMDNTMERNAVNIFSPEEYQKSLEKRKYQEQIGEMLDENRIGYAYQAIIDTSTGDIYGYEALMRPDSDLGITPGDVISYATKRDKLYDVERTTWFNALKGFTSQVDCLSPRKVFINSIPNQLLNDADIAFIENQYGDYLDNVVLEILENEQTDEDFIQKKHALKEKWKCLLALDDFGSGYANENSLLNIKPDLIKLDLDLVANIDKDSDRQSLVKNIVSYAHNRNIKVLAEGIESREQMNILLSLDIDLLQGFYLARPNVIAIDSIDEQIKNEILTFDPNDMFSANVALRM